MMSRSPNPQVSDFWGSVREQRAATMIEWAQRVDPEGFDASLAVLREVMERYRTEPRVPHPDAGRLAAMWNMKIDSPLLRQMKAEQPADDDADAWYDQNGWRF